MAGHCDFVLVTVHGDGSLSVEDVQAAPDQLTLRFPLSRAWNARLRSSSPMN